MFKKYREWRLNRSIKKVKHGDSHQIKPYRFWQAFHRSLFFMKTTNTDGTHDIYAVDIHYFSEKETAELYRNGEHYQTSKLPATFPVADGIIEVATTTYGLKRMHYIREDGVEQVLAPHSHSLEGLRKRLDFRFPQASKIIGFSAIIILLTSIALGLPQLIEFISNFDFIAERWGTFESPITLPEWANMTLIIASTLAALERAITLRNHWLIDMETSWWDIG